MITFDWQKELVNSLKEGLPYKFKGIATYYKDYRNTAVVKQEDDNMSLQKLAGLFRPDCTTIAMNGLRFINWVKSNSINVEDIGAFVVIVDNYVTNLGYRCLKNHFAIGGYQVIEPEWKRINRKDGIIVLWSDSIN